MNEKVKAKPSDLAAESERQLNKAANDALRDSITLAQVPRLGLSPEEQGKLDRMEVMAAFVGAVMKNLLRRRRLPWTEEEARRVAQEMIES